MSNTGKHSFVSIIVGILILSPVLKNLKAARSLVVDVAAALVIAGMAGSYPVGVAVNLAGTRVYVMGMLVDEGRHC